MDGGLAAAVVGGCAIVTAAIVKFVPGKKPADPPTICTAHSGLVSRLESGDRDLAEIRESLKTNVEVLTELRLLVTEIHARVPARRGAVKRRAAG